MKPHVTHAAINAIYQLVFARVISIYFARFGVIVSARGYPQYAMGITLDPLQINGDRDASFFFECRQIDDRQGVLVIRHHIAARIGDIDLAIHDFQFIGLEAHEARIDNLHRHRVNLCDIATLLIVRVNLHWTGIARHIGISSKETDEATVGDINLVFLTARVLVKHIDLVRAINDTKQIAAIDANIITHITHFFWHIGVGIGKYVADILACSIIIIVKCRLVPSHVALTQQIESLDVTVLGLGHRHMLRQENRLLLTASRQQRQDDQEKPHDM